MGPIRLNINNYDSLHLGCPLLWKVILDATKLYGGTSVGCRLGVEGSSIDVRLVAVARVTYHLMKKFGKLRLSRAVRWKDLEANLLKARRAAEAAALDVLS